MNNADATWLFRHVPSINSACKFQLIRNLHCDNHAVYITNAWELKNATTLKLTSWFLPFCVWRLCFSWTASSEFGTYRLCEQRRFRRACTSAQSCQNLHCSLIQALSQEEPSDRKPDPWPFWIAGHAQLKFVMMECSKTQIRLTGLS